MEERAEEEHAEDYANRRECLSMVKITEVQVENQFYPSPSENEEGPMPRGGWLCGVGCENGMVCGAGCGHGVGGACGTGCSKG